MKKIIASLILLTVSGFAETVYVTRSGKAYHQTVKCMSLARTKSPMTAERADAESHGLKACGICYRAAGKGKTNNATWAKEAR